MPKTPFRPSNKLNAIYFLASSVLLLWIMRSGGLAAWDRHSPFKEGPILPWIIALPVAIVGGLLIMPLLTFQICVIVDWWRGKRGE